MLILHIESLGIHISSLYGPILLISTNIWQQYIGNIHRLFSENRTYAKKRKIEIEKS